MKCSQLILNCIKHQTWMRGKARIGSIGRVLHPWKICQFWFCCWVLFGGLIEQEPQWFMLVTHCFRMASHSSGSICCKSANGFVGLSGISRSCKCSVGLRSELFPKLSIPSTPKLWDFHWFQNFISISLRTEIASNDAPTHQTASTKRSLRVGAAVTKAFSTFPSHFDPTTQVLLAESGPAAEYNVSPQVQVPVHLLLTPEQMVQTDSEGQSWQVSGSSVRSETVCMKPLVILCCETWLKSLRFLRANRTRKRFTWGAVLGWPL